MGNINKIFNKIRISLLSKKSYIKYLRKQGVTIGDDCDIYKTASFGSEPYLIKIGNHVRISDGVNFVTHDGGVWVLRIDPIKYGQKCNEIDKFGPISVGNNVHIGTNAIIMPGVKIGNNVIVGCLAVVTHDVPDNSVVAGVPAKRIESIDEYFSKNYKSFLFTKKLSPKQKRKFIEERFKSFLLKNLLISI